MANTKQLEILEISSATDQELQVSYGARTILLGLAWNDVLNQWVLTVKEQNNGGTEVLAAGVTMTINANLLYDKFELGKLYLIDTEPDNEAELYKSDLGKRLALARIY